MISVLICSVNKDLLNNVTENIKKTIGVPFEILIFNNQIEKKGICEVYNQLAAEATFDYLCFLHEDVVLKTSNWGREIVELFSKDEKTGLIGIAGSKYKSGYCSGWYTGVKELDCANYFHQYSSGLEHVFLDPSGNKETEEVVCVDGVMICTKKEVWQNILFNDRLLKGFHFYDIDYSLRVAQHYKVIVSYKIDIVHITSGGDYSNNWVTTAILYHREMKSILPFSKYSINRKKIDKRVVITTMDHLKNYKISFRNKMRWIVFQKLYLNPIFYYSILKFMVYQPLGLKRIHANFKSK